MKREYGKRLSETNIRNSSGYWSDPLTEKTQPCWFSQMEFIVSGRRLLALIGDKLG
jgi:hypothetical protein